MMRFDHTYGNGRYRRNGSLYDYVLNISKEYIHWLTHTLALVADRRLTL